MGWISASLNAFEVLSVGLFILGTSWVIFMLCHEAWREEGVIGAIRMASAILVTIALLAGCTLTPLLLARWIHPAVGCVCAVAAVVLWTRLVRPMPGFIMGIISVGGAMMILAMLAACLMMLVWPPSQGAVNSTQPAGGVPTTIKNFFDAPARAPSGGAAIGEAGQT